jgi:hypothetical protein
MEFIFSKKQLKLNELVDSSDNNSINNSKPALDVSNSENDNDPSSLRTDVEKIKQSNPGKNPLAINTQSYTNKKLPTGNVNGKEMVFQNTSQAPSQIQQVINTTPANALPTKFVIQNGTEREGKLVEVTTFKKKELDKFLKSL